MYRFDAFQAFKTNFQSEDDTNIQMNISNHNNQDQVVYMHSTHGENGKRQQYVNILAVKTPCVCRTHCHMYVCSVEFVTVLVESPDDRLNTLHYGLHVTK